MKSRQSENIRYCCFKKFQFGKRLWGMFSFKQHMKEVNTNIIDGSRRAVYEGW